MYATSIVFGVMNEIPALSLLGRILSLVFLVISLIIKKDKSKFFQKMVIICVIVAMVF